MHKLTVFAQDLRDIAGELDRLADPTVPTTPATQPPSATDDLLKVLMLPLLAPAVLLGLVACLLQLQDLDDLTERIKKDLPFRKE
jgi:hypothetical protein